MVIAVFCAVGELICYTVIFLHVFKQENGQITKLLDPKITKQRNKKNVTTFLGQFIHFVTEIAFLLFVLTVLSFDSPYLHLKPLGLAFKIVEFGFLSMVEVLTSEKLRTTLIKDLRTMNVLHREE